MDIKVQNRILDCIKSGEIFAVATITAATKGSPRKSGTKMLVFPDGSIEFTIGGGKLELQTIKEALEAMKNGQNRSVHVELKPEDSDMICGGSADIYIEIFSRQEEVFIFGAGHVALALSELLDYMDIAYTVADDREEFLKQERFPNARNRMQISYNEFDMNIKKDSYCVIITQGHAGDKDVFKQLLSTESKYIGMIGSKQKVKTLFGELANEGVELPLDRIYTPIGLDIAGSSPKEVACSILSEVLKVKNNKSGRSLREFSN